MKISSLFSNGFHRQGGQPIQCHGSPRNALLRYMWQEKQKMRQLKSSPLGLEMF